jgi:hypothetical protein
LIGESRRLVRPLLVLDESSEGEAIAMFDPYRYLRRVFAGDFRMGFSAVRPDGSRLLVLCDGHHDIIRRRLSARDLEDPRALHRLARSIRFGIAIERGQALLWLAGIRADGAGRNADSARDPAGRRAGRQP